MRSIYRFCALAVAVVLLWGCAGFKNPPPPGGPRAVSLDVQRTAMPGYAHTYGSNGQLYSCKFSGGDDGHGNANVKQAQGPDVPIHLTLVGAANFAIRDVEFTDDPGGQLSHGPPEGLKVVIHDQNRHGEALDAYYSVKVVDNNASPPAEIYCDPRIVNN